MRAEATIKVVEEDVADLAGDKLKPTPEGEEDSSSLERAPTVRDILWAMSPLRAS